MEAQRFFFSRTWNTAFLVSAIVLFFFPAVAIFPQNPLWNVGIQTLLFTFHGWTRTRAGDFLWAAPPKIQEGLEALLALGLLMGLALGIGAMKSWAGIPAPAPWRPQTQGLLESWVILVVSPWREELFFRGLLLEHLRAGGRGPWVAVGASAVVFALAHGPGWNLVFPFCAGIVLGLLVWRRPGRILWAYGVHLVYNLLTALL